MPPPCCRPSRRRLSLILQEPLVCRDEVLCDACLGLVNLVDGLQQKLRSAESDLRGKFQHSRRTADTTPAPAGPTGPPPTQVRLSRLQTTTSRLR